MVSNDYASLIQTEGRVTLVLKEPYQLRGIKLHLKDELTLLSVFTAIIEEKIREVMGRNDIC